MAWPCPPVPTELLQPGDIPGTAPQGWEQAQALPVTLAGQNICYLRFTIEVPQHKNSKKKPNYSQAESSGALTSQGLRQFYRLTTGQLPDPAALTLNICGKT